MANYDIGNGDDNGRNGGDDPEPRRRVKNRPYVVWPAPSKKFEHGKRTAIFQLNNLQIVGVDGRMPKLKRAIQIWKGSREEWRLVDT